MKLRIVNTTGHPMATRIENAETGERLENVQSIRIDIPGRGEGNGDKVTATIVLLRVPIELEVEVNHVRGPGVCVICGGPMADGFEGNGDPCPLCDLRTCSRQCYLDHQCSEWDSRKQWDKQ